MLEKAYWIAGITATIVAIIALFLKSNSNNKTINNQKADVSGKNNSVRQVNKAVAERKESK